MIRHSALRFARPRPSPDLRGTLGPRGRTVATMVATKLATVDIHVVSDTVCPWCYVGKARLSKAMAKYADTLDFRVRWHPYQLNPLAPEGGEDKRAMYDAKFGATRVAAMLPAMARTYEEEGLPPYRVEGLTGNTLNSHRLLLWAAEAHGLAAQNRLVERLFQGYFTQARFINDRAFLLEAAEAAGLPPGGAAEVLDDPQSYLEQTQQELRRYPGVTGVPHFVVYPPGGGRPLARLGGAQRPEEFQEVFDAIVSQGPGVLNLLIGGALAACAMSL
ncbi:MAG: thioredoxin-like protein [Monoraphidium minutum]|nr:MAG: thioredoxin-like protein [Monoraphidium minutum]